MREKRIKHYSSAHNILLVGEGDFSFSVCLGMTFGSATNIIATSLDSYDELINKYKNAKANVVILKALGASLLHGVDAAQMMMLPYLHMKKFHRIIYNFPHAGFYGKENNLDLIVMHRNLVRGFLWNASNMLLLDGEIHISHKITAPFNSWGIEDLALESSLLCIGRDEFRIEDYPGYHNKRGSGSRPDEPFPLGACQTFKFKLCHAIESYLMTPQIFPTPLVSPFTPPAVGMQYQLPSMSPFLHDYESECRLIFGGYLNRIEQTFGDTGCDVRGSVEEALRLGFEMYMGAAPGRPLSGFTGILEELHRLSVLRSERLKLMLLLHDLKL